MQSVYTGTVVQNIVSQIKSITTNHMSQGTSTQLTVVLLAIKWTDCSVHCFQLNTSVKVAEIVPITENRQAVLQELTLINTHHGQTSKRITSVPVLLKYHRVQWNRLKHQPLSTVWFQLVFSFNLNIAISNSTLQHWSVANNAMHLPQDIFQDSLIYKRHSITIVNKKAQLSLTNPHNAKACQNCSNSTCLQRCRWQYWHIFMRLTAIASEIREIPRNSNLWSSRSSILVSIESPYVTCY